MATSLTCLVLTSGATRLSWWRYDVAIASTLQTSRLEAIGPTRLRDGGASRRVSNCFDPEMAWPAHRLASDAFCIRPVCHIDAGAHPFRQQHSDGKFIAPITDYRFLRPPWHTQLLVHAILGIRAPEREVGPGTVSQDRMDQRDGGHSLHAGLRKCEDWRENAHFGRNGEPVS